MTLAAAPPPAPPPADRGQVDHDNPWPGLASFREQDQELFFGRESEIEALRRTTMRESTRATVLFGRSGLGKTSLLQAGLFPRLRRLGVLPVPIRLVYGGARGLVEQVRDAIVAAAAGAGVEAPPLPPEETLWESFHRTGANFWSESNRIVVPLLVFDQFEEVFTLGGQDAAGREAFLTELADLVEGRPPAAVKARLDAEPALSTGFSPERHDYRILLSLRQDFLADLDGLRSRMRSLGTSRLALLHMNGEAALRVVTQAGGHLIEAAVAEKVVRFVAGADRDAGDGDGDGDGANSPPLAEIEVDPTLLSLVCRELNNRRRARGQARITFDLLSGSWKEILTRFYDDSLAGLAPQVRTFVEDRLLTRSGYRDCVAWDNAITEPGVTAADLLTLRDRRLLRFEERHGVTWIELTHDVLTEVIGENRELRRQREARREAEAALQESDERERLARESEREAQRRERQTRRLLVRSHRLAVVLAVVLLAAIALGVLVARLWRRSEAAERRAERALLDSASDLIDKGRVAPALAYLASIMRSNPQDSQMARARALDVLLHEAWPLPVCAVRHGRTVTAADLSPDGERLLTASADGTAHLWRVRDGARLAVLRHAGGIVSAAFSPDGRRLLATSRNGRVQIWDGTTLNPVGRAFASEPPTLRASWSPRGDRILTTSAADARLWDAASQEPLPGAPLPPVAAFSAAGNRLLVARRSGVLSWIDLRSGAAGGDLRIAAPGTVLLSLSPLADRLLGIDTLGTARVWDLASHRLLATREHKALVISAEFSPDGHTLLTVCADRIVRLWNADADGPPLATLQHTRDVIAAHFSPDGRWVLTGTRESGQLWDARLGEAATQPLLHAAPIHLVGLSRDGRRAWTAADDGTAKVWELRPGNFARPQRLPQPVRSALFDDQGREVVALLRNGTARLWDLATGNSSALAPPGQELQSAAFLADGRVATIAKAAAPGAPRVWDGRTGRQLAAPFVPEADWDERPLRLTADGSRTLWSGPAGIDLRDTQSGRRLGRVPDPTGRPMQSSADGRLVLIMSPAAIQVWDTATDRQVGRIAVDRIVAAAFVAGGQLIAVQTADKTLRLFEPRGASVGAPQTLDETQASFNLSRDGKKIAVTSLDGDVTVSEVGSGRVLCQGQGYSQSSDEDPEPFAASIGPRSKRFLARSPEGLAQVWDVESCRPLSEPLWHGEATRVTYARFSPGGGRILTLDNLGTARLWDLPETVAADSEPLADLAEAVSGFAVDRTGNVVPVTDQIALLDHLRARAKLPDAAPSLALQTVRWFFTDAANLTVSPFSTVRAPQGVATP